MPNPHSPDIYVGPLPFVELVSCLSSLAEGKVLPFRDQLRLDAEADSFIQKLALFRMAGCEFFEFALLLEEPTAAKPKTPAQSLQAIHLLPDPAFAHTLFGGELSSEVVDVLLHHFGKLDFLLSRDLKQSPLSHRELEAVFGDIKAFRRGFESAARSLAPFVQAEKSRYASAMDRVKGLLDGHSPLETAQALMGKTFRRVSDYSRYWFVPASFYHRRTMRTFSPEALMVVLPLEERRGPSNRVELVRFLKALGDENRLAMVKRLAEGPCTGTELARDLSLTTATITHHLDQLRRCGLLHEERDGNSKYASLNRAAYQELLQALAQPS